MREIFILSVNTNAPNKSHNINNTQSMHKVSTRFNILKLVTGFWYFPLCNFLIKNILQHSHNICNWIINRIYKLTKCFIICQYICIKLSGQTVIPSDYVIDLYIYTPWTCLTGWGAKCPRSFVEIQFGNNEILDYVCFLWLLVIEIPSLDQNPSTFWINGVKWCVWNKTLITSFCELIRY